MCILIYTRHLSRLSLEHLLNATQVFQQTVFEKIGGKSSDTSIINLHVNIKVVHNAKTNKASAAFEQNFSNTYTQKFIKLTYYAYRWPKQRLFSV